MSMLGKSRAYMDLIYDIHYFKKSSQESDHGSLAQQFNSAVVIIYNKRASLACAARLADTVSAGGALWAPVVTID